MKIFEFIEKKELINLFAKEMARLQKEADRYYYVDNNKEMADFCLIYATELKQIASKLDICKEMYEKSYEIYDFRNSGKSEKEVKKELLEGE